MVLSLRDCEVEVGGFGQRQRIHVATQKHRRPRLAAIEQRGDPAGGLVQGHVERQAVERFQHGVARDRQIVADLRPLVKRAPQRDHVAQQVVRAVVQVVEVHAANGRPERVVEELVDIVDDDDNVITTVTRAEMRARRLQHRSVGIAVMSTDGRLLDPSPQPR